MKQYTPEEIMKLVSIRTAILKEKGHTKEEIEEDIEGYVKVLNDPSKHFDPAGFTRFVEGQFLIYERTKGTWNEAEWKLDPKAGR